MSAPTIPGIDGLAELGRGGFGTVYEGTDGAGNVVAVKVGHRSVHGPRFKREVEALRKIGAPHVPELVAASVLDDGRPYIIMERLTGETLEERIEGLQSPMAIDEATELACQLLDCLEAVHSAGFVHRDLKPANIFVGSDGVRVMDFGLARFDDGIDLTRTGVVVGTVSYSSPEQLAGADVIDERADLYSLGVVLYQLVSLRLPFEGERAEVERGHMMLRPPALASNVAIASAFDGLVSELLAKEPSRRPASAAIVRQRLRSLDPRIKPVAKGGARKRLAGGAEPVVLLAVGGSALPGADVASIVERERGFVARERGNRIIAVFSVAFASEPVAAAAAAARELSDAGCSVALHLDEVLVRLRGGVPPAAYGVGLESATPWIERAHGLHLQITDELAAVAPFLRDDTVLEEPPLLGRETLHRELGTVAASALAGQAELVTLIGDPGVGKSRLAELAASEARRFAANVVELRGRKASADALVRALGGEGAPDERAAALRVAAEVVRAHAGREPLAIVVDDGHLAEPALLDALEIAAADAEDICLLVVVVADPILETGRPEWAKRADRFRTLTIPPLDQEAAYALAEHHLKPAEYPPAQVLRRLAEWSGRNPRLLAELSRALKLSGAIAKRESGEGYYVVTEILDRLPTSRAAQWLESRTLAAMSPDLATFARLVALTGNTASIAELEWILARLDRIGGATTRVDPGVGLAELALLGWMVRIDEDEFEWAREATRDAVYQLIRDGDRSELHGHAFAYAQLCDDPKRIARHGAVLGEHALAAQALLELAQQAHDAREYVASERYATRALELIGQAEPLLRAKILLARGRARYRFHRGTAAATDLDEAVELVDGLGISRLAVAALLEKATALDWAFDFAASKEAAELAQSRITESDGPELQAQLVVALGRTAWRDERLDDATSLLRRGSAMAAAAGDRETEVIGRVLLPLSLVATGDLDEADRAFEDTLSLCRECGDQLHLAAALVNRMLIWEARGETEVGVVDLNAAAQLAREAGQPIIETAATHNLAEIYYFRGDDDLALRTARRSALLADRYFDPVPVVSPLLLARIHHARGENVQRDEQLERSELLGGGTFSPTDRLTIDALRGIKPTDTLVAEAQRLALTDSAVEVCFHCVVRELAARRFDEAQSHLEAMKGLARNRPIWTARLRLLTESIRRGLAG